MKVFLSFFLLEVRPLIYHTFLQLDLVLTTSPNDRILKLCSLIVSLCQNNQDALAGFASLWTHGIVRGSKPIQCLLHEQQTNSNDDRGRFKKKLQERYYLLKERLFAVRCPATVRMCACVCAINGSKVDTNSLFSSSALDQLFVAKSLQYL